MLTLEALRKEFRPTVRLAAPLVLAEIGWMAMGIVDTIMVGHLPNSAAAMGAVSLGSGIFTVLGWFGGGLLLGLDTLVSQAFGAGKREDCHRSLVQGIYLSLALTPLLSAPVLLLPALLALDARRPSRCWRSQFPTLNALTVGLLPLLLYFAFRRCLQAMNMVKPVAFALVTANIINALFNWILIYGHWGAPAMGTVGSGWSTAIARVYMAAVLVGYLLWYDRKHRTELLKTPVDIDLPRIRRLLALGLPAALQITLETGVFATVTTLVAKLGAVPLASHQIALNTVSLTFMVPLGISSAAAVRVGQSLGPQRSRSPREIPAALLLLSGAIFMACCRRSSDRVSSLDRPHVHAGRKGDCRDGRLARGGCRISTLRRYSDRRDRRTPGRRRHANADALPLPRLLGDRPCRSGHGSAFSAVWARSAYGSASASRSF